MSGGTECPTEGPGPIACKETRGVQVVWAHSDAVYQASVRDLLVEGRLAAGETILGGVWPYAGPTPGTRRIVSMDEVGEDELRALLDAQDATLRAQGVDPDEPNEPAPALSRLSDMDLALIAFGHPAVAST